MNERSPALGLIGRELLSARLSRAVERSRDGERSVVLVAGQAGIGKTSLLRAAAGQSGESGVRVSWGTCVDGAGAPGYWPWTQVLNGLARSIGLDSARQLAGDDAALLAVVATALGPIGEATASGQGQLLLMDATARWLDALAAQGPVLIVLDDLQWADDSSLALLEFVARSPNRAAVCLIGAYRHDELVTRTSERLSAVLAHADHLQVDGLDAAAVHALVERVTSSTVAPEVSAAIHRRTGGHPFFVNELSLLSAGSGDSGTVPVAVREAIERRLRHLTGSTLIALEVAAVAGNEVLPDVVSGALGWSAVDLEVAAVEAVAAGVFVSGDNGRRRFTHDLLRETLIAGIEPARRMEIHQAIGSAMERRRDRGGETAAADLARHFCAAIAVDGTDRAARWTLAAAAADQGALAFAEAAGHGRRFRAAANDAGVTIAPDQLVDVLLAEADALTRAGTTLDARGLLRMARDVSVRHGDARRVALVALASAQMGSRFSARRDDVIRELEDALRCISGVDGVLEARLTATLARELQHSVASERPRALPLSLQAIELGRRSGDSSALLACLLARHDVLWTPGTATERAEIAREIADLAQRSGDVERQAEALLLLANAELERGSAAFLAALDASLDLLAELGQPRHRYIAETRHAAVAMLHGELDLAAERIETAANLGARIREPATGNVRMPQPLELVRARGRPDELQAFAAEAVEHWTGAPVHANAVAAGFHARAGDVDRARQHVAVVLDLGTWQADRSYLWSVFVRELSWAAIALDDLGLCEQLLADVAPLAGTCGVNGAVVAFAGSHAHTAGLLAAALGRPGEAATLFRQARTVYERLGARAWLADLNRSGGEPAMPDVAEGARPRFHRAGPLWHLTFHGKQAQVADAKGLADLAILLSRPGLDVHALTLMGSVDRSAPSGTMIDRTALQSYRQRLADLDDESEEAVRHHDDGRVGMVAAEREALLAELRKVTATGGHARQFANHPAERARKAVSARIRAAIASIEEVLPELGEHLNRTIVTGTRCRYTSDDGTRWDVDDRPRP